MFLNKSHQVLLLLTVITGFFLKTILFNFYTKNNNYQIPIDSNQYHQLGKQISINNNFSNENKSPNFFRLPGYPFFLSCLYKTFGINIKKTLFIQIIISILIIPLIFVLSYLLFNNLVVAQISALLTAIHPGLNLFSGLQASEIIFIILLLLYLIFLFSGIKKNKILYFITSGFFLGIASITRSVGEYLFLVTLIAVFILVKKRFSTKIKYILSLFIPWFGVVSLWLFRNYLLTGFIFLHTLTGQHFLRYNAVHILMDANNTSWEKPHQKLFSKKNKIVIKNEKIFNRKLEEIEKDRIALNLAFKIICKYPLKAMKDAIKQVLKTTFTPYSLMFLNLPPNTIFNKKTTNLFKLKMYLTNIYKYPIIIPFIILDTFVNVLLLIGIILFILNIPSKRNLKLLIILFAYILILNLITLSYGCARLRLPSEIFIILISAFTIGNNKMISYLIKRKEIG